MRVYTRVALLALLPLVTGGCSFILVNGPPPGHQELPYFTCTETKSVPILDAMWASLNGVAAIDAMVGDPTEDQGAQIAFALARYSCLDGLRRPEPTASMNVGPRSWTSLIWVSVTEFVSARLRGSLLRARSGC